MCRERILRDFQQSGEVTGRKAIRLESDQRPEGLQAGRLGKGGERQDSFFIFHISRLMEIFDLRQSESSDRVEMYFEHSRNTVDSGGGGAHSAVMKIDDAAARLEALGNSTRLKIYRALVRAGHAGMPVGRLQERLKIPASTLSHHVKALVSVGLISQVREGTTLVCHAEYNTMQGLVDFLVAECCTEETQCKEAQTAA
jgi:DNA-binding transcriptional ArsR family regulator